MSKEPMTLILPILPGKAEAWRRLCQQLLGSRKAHYDDWRRRLGIRRERLWLTRIAGGEVAVAHLETEDWEKAVKELARSEEPFARWLKANIRDIHGIHLDGGQASPDAELLLSRERDQGDGLQMEEAGKKGNPSLNVRGGGGDKFS